MSIPKKGQWVRWVTAEFGREGQVIESRPPSMVVKWLGIDQPQVFPLASMYFRPGASTRMELIEKPAKVPQDRQQAAQGSISVRDAAAALKKTPKQVRMMLRAGKLTGHKKDGKWVGVNL